jgi:signal transduction histidine kinase
MRRTRVFPADPRSVSAARRFVTEALIDRTPEVQEAAELMVSELATNCVRHVKASFDLTIRKCRSEIRVEVADRGGGNPQMRSPGPDEPTGRGLRIVDMLSTRWGVELDKPTGKTVWFTLIAPPQPDHAA